MPSPQDIQQLQERLSAHRATLATLLTQQATLGSAYAPPGVANGIREARAGIATCKANLRSWGVELAQLQLVLDSLEAVPPPPMPVIVTTRHSEEAIHPRSVASSSLRASRVLGGTPAAAAGRGGA